MVQVRSGWVAGLVLLAGMGPSLAAVAVVGCRAPGEETSIETCTAVAESGAEPAKVKAFALHERARLRFAGRDKPGALADIEAALKLDPALAAAYNSRGYLMEDERPAAALADYTKAIELDPSLAVAYNNRGAVLRDTGDLEGSSRDLEMAIKLAPNSVPPLLDRALLRERKDDLAGALEDVEAAIVLAPDYQPAKDQRARLKARIAERK